MAKSRLTKRQRKKLRKALEQLQPKPVVTPERASRFVREYTGKWLLRNFPEMAWWIKENQLRE